MVYDCLVVGAGFAGAVVAERVASSGKSVLVIDEREHIGGNAFDEHDPYGVLVHRYGPHIFHTNSLHVFEYLSQFTKWRKYEHRVLAQVEGRLVPIPINRTTINGIYGTDLDEEGAKRFLESVREVRDRLVTSEDVVLASVGRDLCEKLFRGYTRKQWGLDLSELSPTVAARIPTRSNDDDRYFEDRYQFMPKDGYTSLFDRMLQSPRIHVELNTTYASIRSHVKVQHTVYTGPIDAYFDECYGKLPYRSLLFEHQHYPHLKQYQAVGTVNYPNSFDFTRTTEFKHLTGQEHEGTSIVREFPLAQGAPFYPIPRPCNETLYGRYKELAMELQDVTFVGRLAQYRYYNMDQVVGAALHGAGRIVARLHT